jgi:hypothetical protein
MRLDSVPVLEHATPPSPPKRKRKHALVPYQPIPAGDDCLTLVRAQELFHGKAWTPAEEEHCRTCNWCWYFVSHDEAQCFKARQLLEIAGGRGLTEEEWEHLGVCPSCAYDFDLLKQEAATPAPQT